MNDWNLIMNPCKKTIVSITPVTGTTTNDYVDAIEIDTRLLDETIITVANTASVNDLTYSVLVYNDYATGIGHETISGVVAISDSDQVILRRHSKVKIQIKSSIGGNHTTYQVDIIAGRK